MSGILAGIFLVCVIAALAFAGVAATTIAVIAVICVIFTFAGVNQLLPGLHSYAV